jgi:serine protease Do
MRIGRILAATAVATLTAACSAQVAGYGISGRGVVGATPRANRVVTVTATPTATASASSAKSFSQIYAHQRSGVVRIETVGCSDSGVGTGFLLSPTEVVTVAHVVDQAVVVSLKDAGQRTTGTVVGIDRSRDLALVRATAPLAGYHFRLADRLPQVGDDVAAIGFPVGDPITFTRGTISGLHRHIVVDGSPRTGMIETDAAVNPGNSGGPLLGEDGSVYGLVDAKNMGAEGIAFAVPAASASLDVAGWRRGSTYPGGNCSDPLGPSQGMAAVVPPAGVHRSAAYGIARAFTTYFDGINTGDYQAAWNVLSPQRRANSSYESFADGDATSYDTDVVVIAASQSYADQAQVALAFTSLQRSDKGPDGDVCDNWTLDYSMIRLADGAWYIDDAQPFQGSSHTAC